MNNGFYLGFTLKYKKPQEIVVQDIKNKFVYLNNKQTRDYDFTLKNQELRENEA